MRISDYPTLNTDEYLDECRAEVTETICVAVYERISQRIAGEIYYRIYDDEFSITIANNEIDWHCSISHVPELAMHTCCVPCIARRIIADYWSFIQQIFFL